MKARSLLIPLFAALIAFGMAGAAEKAKQSDVSDYPFWNAKKRGSVKQFVPGLNAVLQLTDEQKEQISAVRDQMSDFHFRVASSIKKDDPSVTAEQRDKARAGLEAGITKLRERVATILTAEQKALIDKINAAYAAAVEETGIVYEDKLGSVKADEAARRRLQEEKAQDTEEQFLHKLDGLLTSSQKQAMTARAAEEEQRQNTKGPANKKPVK